MLRGDANNFGVVRTGLLDKPTLEQWIESLKGCRDFGGREALVKGAACAKALRVYSCAQPV